MNHSGYGLARWLLMLCLLVAVATEPALAKPQAASSDTPSPETTAKKSKQKSKNDGAAAPRRAGKPAAGGPASDADIAAAKSSGKVWVNLSSGVYHKGGRWYGKTKNGKFMTEAEAKAAGYKGSQKD